DFQFIGDGDPNVIRFGDLGSGGIQYIRIDGGFGGHDTFTNVPSGGGARILPGTDATNLFMEIVSNFATGNSVVLDDSGDVAATYSMTLPAGGESQLIASSVLHPHAANINFENMTE